MLHLVVSWKLTPVIESFGNYFFNRKFANFESPPHTKCVRARQETRNFNSEFEFSE